MASFNCAIQICFRSSEVKQWRGGNLSNLYSNQIACFSNFEQQTKIKEENGKPSPQKNNTFYPFFVSVRIETSRANRQLYPNKAGGEFPVEFQRELDHFIRFSYIYVQTFILFFPFIDPRFKLTAFVFHRRTHQLF